MVSNIVGKTRKEKEKLPLLIDNLFYSNNNVKYYVYKVFKEASDLHLAKVINVEETVRRILPILGSNDTIARSITLRYVKLKREA